MMINENKLRILEYRNDKECITIVVLVNSYTEVIFILFLAFS